MSAPSPTPTTYSPDSIRVLSRRAVQGDRLRLVVTAPATTVFRAGYAMNTALPCDRSTATLESPSRFVVECPALKKGAILYSSIMDGDFSYTFEKSLW